MNSEEFPLPHSVAAKHLTDAWPAPDVSFVQECLLYKATGRGAFSEECGERRPDVHDLVDCSAAALELLQMLAASLDERAAYLLSDGRPTEYARRDLVRSLGDAYRDLHAREPKYSRSAGHATKQDERNILPDGPLLDWLRGLLDLVSERSGDPVMADLADWGHKPDAMPNLLREIFGGTKEKNP
jgi:hypothetical protein